MNNEEAMTKRILRCVLVWKIQLFEDTISRSRLPLIAVGSVLTFVFLSQADNRDRHPKSQTKGISGPPNGPSTKKKHPYLDVLTLLTTSYD